MVGVGPDRPGTLRSPRMGEMITFRSNGSTAEGYLAVPEGGTGPGVLVIQEWWGLVPHITEVADRFAAEGFVALAPDLYHGESSTEPDGAGKLMMGLNLARAGEGPVGRRRRAAPALGPGRHRGSSATAWAAGWPWWWRRSGPTR